MTDQIMDEVMSTVAPMDRAKYEDDAIYLLEKALVGLTVARENTERDDPHGRDLSIAITHVEDALLRVKNRR